MVKTVKVAEVLMRVVVSLVSLTIHLLEGRVNDSLKPLMQVLALRS